MALAASAPETETSTAPRQKRKMSSSTLRARQRHTKRFNNPAHPPFFPRWREKPGAGRNRNCLTGRLPRD
eukprot:11191315-Lingulodinium_polyedra.AAC.1